jgi:predicted ATP-grasp superfamily ATP-dependent carboligase
MVTFFDFMLGLPTRYVLHVWDCRGIFRSEDEEEQKYIERTCKYVKCGPFDVPVPHSVEVNDELKKKLEEWCWEILRRNRGGINISGVYRVFADQLEELENILERCIEEAEPCE